ncbi:oligopeptide ABC transporter ATP-binding protein [Acetobacter nitrogenifigens DSM 23921 = NBRC 105050]|uniref:ABC transporter ATP-binding protein n=1 Tax=Acetobacter nitrogenifigens DSM 23921 = NBRC 105050 TaxID=1120919 RepID=A0A511XCN7_9PROT|nr:ABC transporter ATP-binding protein [Acetobacter nitrogenifigens]GBQ87890.1 oligopeptide ABC transporter ATP-binding protein [Acetobacter nitrogenifigens DSM 23921 = NBRC 105050]GEN60700.1 ABC transporter ATP-binding protein [Acetobacter nitrogenifigens DSM 23921 = NBRC 105050]
MTQPALSLEDFSVSFGETVALERISLTIARGETLALVGESGSGKSVAALSTMGLLGGGRISGGRALLTTGDRTVDLAGLSERSFRALRGRNIGMIFQEPMSALNPAMKIGAQINECLVLHRDDLNTGEDRRREAAVLLGRTGIADPERCLSSYPHQLSGGMRQRVMIAMALSAAPALLIADEPTTALDAGTRGRILALIRDMATERGTATLFITHDFGAASAIADRVAVLYAGRMLEEGPIADVLGAPRHPYTKGLLASLPNRASMTPDARGRLRLRGMAGSAPAPGERPEGCVFAPRCLSAQPACMETQPALRGVAVGHNVACLRADEWAVAP